jgi:integrase
MGRQHIKDGRIAVVQVKTGHRLTLPLLDELAHEIAQHDGLTFLTTSFGKPFSVDGFGNWFREAVREAGIEGKSPHGLRKAAGRRLAEAGCTAKEIAAVLGHRTLNEVARYTRDADQAKLSDSAMRKVGESKTRTG